MKNKLFSKIGIVLVSMAMAIGVGVAASTNSGSRVARAEPVVLVIDSDTLGLNGTATSEETTPSSGGVSYKVSSGAKYISAESATNKFTNKAIMIGKSGAYIANTTAIPGNITKFELYANKGASSKVSVGINFSATAIDEYDADLTSTYTATLSTVDNVYDCSAKLASGTKYFWYQVTNANNSQVQFRITYTPTGPSVLFDNPTNHVAVGGNVTNTATGQNLGGNAISYSSSDNNIASVNASTGEVTGVAIGQATITATATVDEVPVSTNYVINVTSSSSAHYNVAQARAIVDTLGIALENSYVDGIVYKIDSFDSENKTLTYWISDNGTSKVALQIYKGLGIGGAEFTAITDIKVGDKVTVTGTLTKYSSTYELDANNQLVSKSSVASLAVKTAPTKVAYNSGEAIDPTGLVVTATYQDSSTTDFTYSSDCKVMSFDPEVGSYLSSSVNKLAVSVSGVSVDQAITVASVPSVINVTFTQKEIALDVVNTKTAQLAPTVVVEQNADATVAYESSNPLVATVSEEGLVTAVRQGKATITATSTFDNAKKDTCTVTVTDPNLLNFTWNLGEASYASAEDELITWSNDNATMTNAKGDGTKVTNYIPAPSNSNTHTRMYRKNTLTITPKDYHIIEYVEVEGTSKANIDDLQSGSLTNAAAYLDNKVVSIYPNDVTKAISVKLADDADPIQVVSVKVFYKPIVLDSVALTMTDEQKVFTAGSKFAFAGTLTASYNCVASKAVTPASFRLNAVDGTEITTNTTLTHDAHNGKTVYVVYTENNVTKSATFVLTVNYKAVANIALDRASATLPKSGTVTINATVTDEFADQTVTWTTSDATVAALSATSGATVTVTASATNTGDATITATAVGGKTATCTIKVSDDPIVELDTVLINNAFTGDADKVLTATAANFLAGEVTYTWTSSAETVATVTQSTTEGNKATVHYVGAGTANIIVSATDGSKTETAVCAITVTASAVTSITLASSVEDGKLYLGTSKTSLTLTPTIEKVGNATEDLTWTSTDATVASVNNGAVTALKAGTATIEAKSTYTPDKTASFVVTVVAPDSLKIVSKPTTLKYAIGETFSSEGLVVKGVYGEEELDITGYTVSTPDMTTAGKKTVTVSLLGKEATFEIVVIEKANLTKVLGEADLLVGDQLLIVAPKSGDSGYAMMTPEVNNTYLKPADVTIGENGIENIPVYENLVTLGGQKDAWTLMNQEGKFLGVSADKKVEWVEADSEVLHTWKIYVNDDGSFTIESTDATLGKLQYNKSSPRFVNYASGSQANPSIYKVGAKGLSFFQEQAAAEIDAYAASKGQSNYSAAGWTEIQGYVSTGKSALPNTKSISDINKVLANVKSLIDSVKTKAQEELDTAKANALDELSKYYNEKDPTKYTQENIDKLTAEYNKGREAISAATSVAAVNAALTNAKASLDAVEQIQPKKGCFGSIEGTSIILSVIALAGVGLLVYKKKQEN